VVLFGVRSSVGDTVKVDRVAGTFTGEGGEFKLSNVTGSLAGGFVGGAAALDGSSFQSYCIETDEFINPGSTYDYVVNTQAMLGGANTNSGDPISPATAYLFTGFTLGTLTTPYNYTVGAGRAADARSMQLAFWLLEDEFAVGDGSSRATEYAGNAKAQSFVTEATGAGWTDIGNVRVLNLTASGAVKQDMLVMVPLPAAVWAGGSLLGCMGVAGRFRRRRET
jgi:hypothetical protein